MKQCFSSIEGLVVILHKCGYSAAIHFASRDDVLTVVANQTDWERSIDDALVEMLEERTRY